MVKQYVLKQDADKADWLIGAGLFKKNVKGAVLRSMKEPGSAYDDPVIGKDPQPGHMKDYVETTSDNGGVHINSGIPNRAFYLTAIELGGKAWEKAGMIWYVTLRDRLRENSTFQDAARLTYSVAGSLFGKGSPEQKVCGEWLGGRRVTDQVSEGIKRGDGLSHLLHYQSGNNLAQYQELLLRFNFLIV